MEKYLRVGVITSPHGVRGEVKVYPTTDDVMRFKKLDKVILDLGRGETRELKIRQVKFFKNMVILKFKGYDNINDIFPDQCHRIDGRCSTARSRSSQYSSRSW